MLSDAEATHGVGGLPVDSTDEVDDVCRVIIGDRKVGMLVRHLALEPARLLAEAPVAAKRCTSSASKNEDLIPDSHTAAPFEVRTRWEVAFLDLCSRQRVAGVALLFCCGIINSWVFHPTGDKEEVGALDYLHREAGSVLDAEIFKGGGGAFFIVIEERFPVA